MAWQEIPTVCIMMHVYDWNCAYRLGIRICVNASDQLGICVLKNIQYKVRVYTSISDRPSAQMTTNKQMKQYHTCIEIYCDYRLGICIFVNPSDQPGICVLMNIEYKVRVYTSISDRPSAQITNNKQMK